MIWGGGTSICCSFSRDICERHGMVRYISGDVGYHSGMFPTISRFITTACSTSDDEPKLRHS